MKKKLRYYLSNFLLGNYFQGQEIDTRVRVVLINLISPIAYFLVFFSALHSWENGLRPQEHIVISLSISVVNFSAYIYFRIFKNIYRHISFISVTILCQIMFVFYTGGRALTGIYWVFLVAPIFTFSNKRKTGIVLTFLLLIVILGMSYQSHLIDLYGELPLVKFRIAFFLEIMIVLGVQIINEAVYVGYKSKTEDLAFTNERLEQVIKVQNKLSNNLQKKEIENLNVLRDLRAIINNTKDFIWFVDSNFNLKIYNDAFKERIMSRFNVNLSSIQIKDNHRFDNVVLNEWISIWKKRFGEVATNESTKTFVDQRTLEDGSTFFLVTDVFPVISDGVITGIACFSRDITYEKKAQAERESLTQLNATIIASLGEIIYDYSISEDRFTWNDAISPILGYTKAQIGENMAGFLSKLYPDDRVVFEKEFKGLLASGSAPTSDLQIRNRNNEYLWLQNRMNLLVDSKGKPERIIGALVNINHRKYIEKQKLEAVVKGVDEERKRIASEIHDGLGQTLIAASLIMQSLDAVYSETTQVQLADKLSSIKNLVNSAIEESRTMSHNLMPKSLEEFGLISSIKSLVNRIREASVMIFEFHFNVDEKTRFSSVIENNLYRVTQESLTNIIKHSQASKVEIQLVSHQKFVILTIEDNGKGSANLGQVSHEGIGLDNIKNRIASIGGHLEIDSHEGYGTLLTIEVAVNE